MKPNTKKPKSPPPPQVKKGREKDIKKLKNVEKMEKMKKKKNPQKKDNLYKIKKKRAHNREYNRKYNSETFYRFYLREIKKRNKNKRKSGYIVKKLGLPKEKFKFTLEKPPTRFAKGECVVCLTYKKMTEKNTIKCGETVNVLCEDCKGKLKKNECPLCRSHTIKPINTVSEIKANEIYSNTNYSNFIGYYTRILISRYGAEF